MMPKYYQRALTGDDYKAMEEELVVLNDDLEKAEKAFVAECQKVERCRRLGLRHKNRINQLREEVVRLRAQAAAVKSQLPA